MKQSNAAKVEYEFKYFVHVLQTLFNGAMPKCFTTSDVGIRRRLVIDWEAAISDLWPDPGTQPDEGSLFVLQVMLTDRARWDGHTPMIYQRLTDYRHWVMPLPPSLLAVHLNRDLLSGEVATTLFRFHALRHQIFRFLGGRSLTAARALRSSFERLMLPVIAKDRPKGASELVSYVDTVRLAETEGLSPFQLEAEYHVQPIPMAPRTSLAEELVALLRGERFGAVKDKNYLFVRHEGYAKHLEETGDVTPFHDSSVVQEQNYGARIEKLTHNIRITLRTKFRQASDVTATRLFQTTPALRNATYDPVHWSVMLRHDVSRSLRESGLSARRRREGSLKAKTERPHRFVRILVPIHLQAYAEEVSVVWRRGTTYVNAKDLKMWRHEAGVAGLSVYDFIAFDEKGRATSTPEMIATYYVKRAILAERDMLPFAHWLGGVFPSKESLVSQYKTPTKKRYTSLYTEQMDEELLALWKPYQRNNVWNEFASKYGCKATDAKRRAEFVAFALRRRNLTLKELRDFALTERRVGPKAWKTWASTARKACA